MRGRPRLVSMTASTAARRLKAFAERGHEVLFLERDVPWYAAHRDLPDPAFCRLALSDGLGGLDAHADAIAGADAVMVGDIVDTAGRKLGEHGGIIHFTVGQRRGLEIGGSPEPLYVVRRDAERQQVVVGPRRALAVAAAQLTDINWLGGDFDGPLTAKVRSMAKPVPARLQDGRLVFDSPEYGVAPGQAAVLYAGERVLGGGWIAQTESAVLEAAA